MTAVIDPLGHTTTTLYDADFDYLRSTNPKPSPIPIEEYAVLRFNEPDRGDVGDEMAVIGWKINDIRVDLDSKTIKDYKASVRISEHKSR